MKRLLAYFAGGLALLGLAIASPSFIAQQPAKENFRTTDCKEARVPVVSAVPSKLLLQLRRSEEENHIDGFQNRAGETFASFTSTCNLRIHIVLHPVRESGALSSELTRTSIGALFEKTRAIWNQASIVFDVEVRDVQLDSLTSEDLEKGRFRTFYRILSPTDDAFHIFFVKQLARFNGVAIPPSLALVGDKSKVSVHRVVAHEIGHLLGLKHNFESVNRLLFPGTNGMILTQSEIAAARAKAILLQRTTDRETRRREL